MPRPRPPHLHRETTRHGRVVWYVRVGHGPRIRLPVGPGREGFDAACVAAIEPGITDLRNRAIGAGWHPAEVAAAILSLTVSDIRDHAGDDAA